MIFQVGKTYYNRVGTYTVLKINNDKMLIGYSDGTQQTVSVDIQAKIIENMEIEAVGDSPYLEDQLNHDYFFTIGFISKRASMLEAIVPPHSDASFRNNYQIASGIKVNSGTPGYYLHHDPNVDKWSYELRITFNASAEELPSLRFGPDVHVVSDPTKQGTSWRINNNAYWWRLIRFGFVMGPNQIPSSINNTIPLKFQQDFQAGLLAA